MKRITSISCCIILIASCKKKEDMASVLLPPGVTDSTFTISTVIKIDLNEVDINYLAKPPVNQSFSEVFLNWSTSVDFSQDKDSTAVTVTGSSAQTFSLKGLKQATKYYGRVSALYNGKRIFSALKDWLTDTLKIVNIGYGNPPWAFNKGDSFIVVRTNLPSILPTASINTRIFIGPYECIFSRDEGTNIFFHIPATMPSGKYLLELRRKGASAFSPDSMSILSGRWTNLTPPVLPLNPAAATSGLFSFGTCQSPQKGYMLGGAFFNGLGSGPETMNMGFLLEFNPANRQWTRRNPPVSRFFEDPICYYYNNGIYVVGGRQRVWDAFGNDRYRMIKKMLRLDLTSLTWSELDSMPVYGNYHTTSFELANEWYVGMGSDSANLSVCCGVPLPSKKFFKYSPVTNQWIRLTDFPGGHQVFPTCFSIGSKGYAFYGGIPIGDPVIATNFLQELWEYDPFSNSWTRIALPVSGGPPQGEKYQVVVYNGKAYFITAQKYSVGCCFYYMALQNVCLEWDPITNIYKKVAYPQNGEVMKLIYAQNNQFVFQSEALGAFERIPNRTFLFDINQ
jgi:hypothetical protein